MKHIKRKDEKGEVRESRAREREGGGKVQL